MENIIPIELLNEASRLSKEGHTVEAYEMISDYLKHPQAIPDRDRGNVGWILYRYLKDAIASSTGDLLSLRRILWFYVNISHVPPNLLHSMMLLQALLLSEKHEEFLLWKFFEIWGGVSAFRPEDWEGSKREVVLADSKRKRKMEWPSLAAKVAKSIINRLVESEEEAKDDALAVALAIGEELLKHGEVNAETIRSIAKVHIKAGNRDRALLLYKGLVTQRHAQPYMWRELGDLLSDQPMVQLGLLAKSISMQREEKFSVKVYLVMAELFLEQGMLVEAKYALSRHKAISEENGWHIRSLFQGLWKRVAEVADLQVKQWNHSLTELQIFADEYLEENTLYVDLVLIKRWEKGGKQYAGLCAAEGYWCTWPLRKNDPVAKASLGSIWRGIVVRDDIDNEYEEDAEDVFELLDSREARVVRLRSMHGKPWSLLPDRVGYVGVVNPEKAYAFVYTPDDKSIYLSLQDISNKLHVGDYVRFRTYLSKRKNGKEEQIVGLEVVQREDVIGQYKTCEAIVVHVQSGKMEFRYATPIEGISGVIVCSEEKSMPQVASGLQIWYHNNIRKNGSRQVTVLHWESKTNISKDFCWEVEGTLRLTLNDAGQVKFGFIGNCYVPSGLIVKAGIEIGCPVHAIVYRQHDKSPAAVTLEMRKC